MKKHLIISSGDFHYVTFVCNGRRKLLAKPVSRQIVISSLNSIVTRKIAHVSGFVVMPNHVHAILWLDDDTQLSRAMQLWKGVSSRRLRTYYENAESEILEYLRTVRNGREFISFWERGYYDFNISSPVKLAEKLRYMHENPVRLDLVSKAEDYKWSSASWYEKRRSVGINIEPGF